MKPRQKPLTLLIADDDPDDRFIIEEALRENSAIREIHCVENGEDLLNYLRHQGRFAQDTGPRPDVILLDLNMPRKGGRQAIREIKADPELQHIPIVVLTTSQEEEDIQRSYQLGVNSFITKPNRFDDFVETLKIFGKFWFETVELPREGR